MGVEINLGRLKGTFKLPINIEPEQVLPRLTATDVFLIHLGNLDVIMQALLVIEITRTPISSI